MNTPVESVVAIAERLASASRAVAVYLHGDRARGEAEDDAPWELLVVLPADVEPGRWTPVSLWRLVADAPMSIEVRAVTATTFAADRDDPNAVSAEAARHGSLLYARHPDLRADPNEAAREAYWREHPTADATYADYLARTGGADLARTHAALRDSTACTPRSPMAEPYLAPVVWTGRRFVLRQSGVPLTGVEVLRAAGYSAEAMVAKWPDLVLEEVAAYLADDLVETESVAYARADARDYAERREASRRRRRAAR